jgi:hypothetical protein
MSLSKKFSQGFVFVIEKLYSFRTFFCARIIILHKPKLQLYVSIYINSVMYPKLHWIIQDQAVGGLFRLSNVTIVGFLLFIIT